MKHGRGLLVRYLQSLWIEVRKRGKKGYLGMIAWQMMFRKEKRDGKDEGQFEAWLSPGCSKLLLPDQRSTKCEAQAGSGNDSRTCGPDTVLR